MTNEIQRSVFCTLTFESYHNCPGFICENTDEAYLKFTHRHIFHVRCEAAVSHNNRDIEFINLKHRVQKFCEANYHKRFISVTSCEMIAEAILRDFPELHKVEVSEDGENGAVLSRNICQYRETVKHHEDDLR